MDQKIVHGSQDRACITDIQRFSVHDGPGIRTIVFFKGCPLRCKWCQNPETNDVQPEVMWARGSCVGCGECIRKCPNGAIEITPEGTIYHRDRCTVCGACVAACGPEARRIIGHEESFEKILETVLADRVFYKNSNGGLTASGGEPTMQAEFVARLFRAVHAEGINTAIETCGMCAPERFKLAIEDCDLLLFDVKHTDSATHKKYTGVGNEVILQNLRNAAAAGKNIIIRIPLIPGVNDGDENLLATAQLAKECRAREVHLLPFHQLGQGKWRELDKEYELETWELPSDALVSLAAELLKTSGVSVNVGGHGDFEWL